MKNYTWKNQQLHRFLILFNERLFLEAHEDFDLLIMLNGLKFACFVVFSARLAIEEDLFAMLATFGSIIWVHYQLNTFID